MRALGFSLFFTTCFFLSSLCCAQKREDRIFASAFYTSGGIFAGIALKDVIAKRGLRIPALGLGALVYFGLPSLVYFKKSNLKVRRSQE